MPVFDGAQSGSALVTYDIGDVVPLSAQVRDSSGVAADGGSAVLSILQPDGTTKTSPADFTIAHTNGTGLYTYGYTPTSAGHHAVTWTVTGANAGVHVDTFNVRDPAGLPVVSLAQIRAYLKKGASGTTDTSDDDILAFFAASATELCERHRPLRRTAVVETFDGGGLVILSRTPAISVASVTENGLAVPYVANLKTGIVSKGTTSTAQDFGDGVQNVVVTYVAGYQTIPAVGQHAVLEQIRHMYATQRGSRPSPSGSGPDQIPAGAFMLTFRVQELLDSLGRVPGFA